MDPQRRRNTTWPGSCVLEPHHMDAQTYRRLRGCDGRVLGGMFRDGLRVVKILTTYLLVSGNGKLISVQQTENGNMQ